MSRGVKLGPFSLSFADIFAKLCFYFISPLGRVLIYLWVLLDTVFKLYAVFHNVNIFPFYFSRYLLAVILVVISSLKGQHKDEGLHKNNI